MRSDARPYRWRGIFSGLLVLLALIVSGREQRPAAAKPRPLNVFLFAGQSNMAGADSLIADPPGFQSIEADRNTLFTGAPLPEGAASPDYCPWAEVRGHRARTPRYGDRLVHGPEVGFERRLYEKGVRDVAIIAAWGNFSREATTWPWADGGDMHRPWERFVAERLGELKSRGRDYRVRGFVWHQGIDDAIHGGLAPQYQENLTALIGVLRHRYAKQDTPFILARSGNSPIARRISGSGPDDPMAVVRRAQVKVGETVPAAAWIDVDDLPNVVEHHFSAESQLSIGRRFADAWLKLSRR